MHNYFANGICSSEMLAFQERFSKTTGFTLKDLQQSVHEVAWVCRDKSFRAPSSRSWLFNEQFWQGEMYKGSASQTYFALPLLVHYGNLLANVDDLPCLESLNALYQVVLELKKCRRGCGDYTQLESSQSHHQRLFMLHHEGQERPKHHFRLHLPDQYRRLRYCDCWPCEARHKAYKASLADDLSAQFVARQGQSSKQILARLLHRQAWSLAEHPWMNKMAGQIHGAEAVEAATGLTRVRISNAFQLQAAHVQSDDVICFDGQAGWAHFFVEEADGMFCVLENLREIQTSVPFSRTFVRTDCRVAKNIKDLLQLHQPVWWHLDGETVLCLF